MKPFEFKHRPGMTVFSRSIQDKRSSRICKPPRIPDVPERMLKYSNAEELAKELDLSENARNYVMLSGYFIYGDLIEAIIYEKDFIVKEMTISTLSYNEGNVDSLAGLIDDGRIQKLNIVISDYFYSHERRNIIKYTYQELDKDDKFQLAVAGTHSKVVLFETVAGEKIVMHGSANLRASGNIEQVMIEHSAALYDFNQEIFSATIEKYRTIGKRVRYDKLWSAIGGK